MEDVRIERAPASVSRATYHLATRGQRLRAAMIDWGIASVIMMGVLFPVIFFTEDLQMLLMVSLLTLVILSLYSVMQMVLLTKYGQTIGKRSQNIKIVKSETGENGGFVTNVLIRSVVNSALSSLIPFYAYVDIFFIFGEEQRCIHDRIAGTIVVDVRSFNPLETVDVLSKDINFMNVTDSEVLVNRAAQTKKWSPAALVVILVLSVILISGILAGFAVLAYNYFVDIRESIPSASDEIKFEKTFISKDGKCAISASSTWEEVKEEEIHGFSLYITTKSKNRYMLIGSNSKKELEYQFSLGDYADLLVDEVAKDGNIINRYEPLITQVGDYKLYQVEAEYVVEGMNFKYLITIIETEENYYHTMAWSHSWGYNMYKDEFVKMLESFEEIYP